MAIYVRLTKVGKQSALFLDPNLIASLGMEPENPVKISLVGNGKVLQIEPITEQELAEEDKRLYEKATKEGFEQYGDMYRRLADR